MSGHSLEPEFSLLVRCCRWNFATDDDYWLPEFPIGMDWNRFVALARRHRIQGLAWNALAKHADRLPAGAADILSSDARSIAATNLAMAAECRDLQRLFHNQGVALLFVKGLTVAALAYRSPMLKMGWDIDLLVDPRDLAAAAGLLTQCGYTLRLPASRRELQRWHEWSKESVWVRNRSIHVELHTRLADNCRLIPGIDVHGPRQMVEVAPGIDLPTLADDELVAYLTIHGASSAWFRLKWISDFAALLNRRSGEEIGRLYRRSQHLGAGRAAGQALLLADEFFGTLDQDTALRDELQSDHATRLIGRAAMRMMTNGAVEPTDRILGTLPIHWTQFLLQPEMRYKFSELRRQAGGLLRRVAR